VRLSSKEKKKLILGAAKRLANGDEHFSCIAISEQLFKQKVTNIRMYDNNYKTHPLLKAYGKFYDQFSTNSTWFLDDMCFDERINPEEFRLNLLVMFAESL
jgi:hypothetical protein